MKIVTQIWLYEMLYIYIYIDCKMLFFFSIRLLKWISWNTMKCKQFLSIFGLQFKLKHGWQIVWYWDVP